MVVREPFAESRISDLAAEFEARSAEDVIAWTLKEFGADVAISTSLQAEGMVILDMATRIDPAVARALAGSPSILLADEPTENLDSKNGEAVMKLMENLHQEGATICMVTHDPRYSEYAERTVHLFDGAIVDESDAATK